MAAVVGSTSTIALEQGATVVAVLQQPGGNYLHSSSERRRGWLDKEGRQTVKVGGPGGRATIEKRTTRRRVWRH